MNTITMSILMDAFFIGLLIWCAYSDLKTRTVPNIAVTLLLYLVLIHMILIILSGDIWWTYPLGLVFAVPFLISWIKTSMGAGDVKLVMAIALYLGFLNTIITFVLMVPVIIILIIRAWIKQKTLKYRIPFAPILAFGAIGVVVASHLYTLIYA